MICFFNFYTWIELIFDDENGWDYGHCMLSNDSILIYICSLTIVNIFIGKYVKEGTFIV